MRMTKGQTVVCKCSRLRKRLTKWGNLSFEDECHSTSLSEWLTRLFDTESGEKCRDKEEAMMEAENDSEKCVLCLQERPPVFFSAPSCVFFGTLLCFFGDTPPVFFGHPLVFFFGTVLCFFLHRPVFFLLAPVFFFGTLLRFFFVEGGGAPSCVFLAPSTDLVAATQHGLSRWGRTTSPRVGSADSGREKKGLLSPS